MSRPSFVALLAIALCTMFTWMGTAVVAQPGTLHMASVDPPADHDVFRSLLRGGYRPGSATRPSQLLDLRNWYLTLPTGSAGDPDTVRQPDLESYSSPFFQVDEQRDGVVCTANAGGVTTKNSSYPRSELREMNGGEHASWSNLSGSHTLAVRQAVTQLPTVKPELVTAQIHDAESAVMEIRLEDKRLIAQYGGGKNSRDSGDGKKEVVLDPDYALGTPYDLRIVAASGRIDVWYNSKQVGGTAQSGSGWYFKTGSYLQSNTDKGDAADAVGKVVLYQVGVTHSG
jgi:hypothetical protein